VRLQGYCVKTDDCTFPEAHQGLCSTPKRMADELKQYLIAEAERELLDAAEEAADKLDDLLPVGVASRLAEAIRRYREAKR
jgi:hypothetical protein